MDGPLALALAHTYIHTHTHAHTHARHNRPLSPPPLAKSQVRSVKPIRFPVKMTRPFSGERRRPESVRIVQAGRKFRMSPRGTSAFPLATGQRPWAGQGRRRRHKRAHFDWASPLLGKIHSPPPLPNALAPCPQIQNIPHPLPYHHPPHPPHRNNRKVQGCLGPFSSHPPGGQPGPAPLDTHLFSFLPVPAAVLNRNTSESQNYFISAPSSLLQGPHPLFRPPRAPDLETIRWRFLDTPHPFR